MTGQVASSIAVSIIALPVAIAATWTIYVATGYVVWAVKGSATDLEADIDVPPADQKRDAKVKVIDSRWVSATRFSTITPRWMVSSAAVTSLSRAQRDCLVSHEVSYVHSRGPWIYYGTAAVGALPVFFAPELIATVVSGVPPLVSVVLVAVGDFAVCLPAVKRWLVYRADRRAAANCDTETYLDFLETTARVEPSRPVWLRWLTPTPKRRLEKFRDHVSAGETAD
ncbi:hypothetical protein [Natronomonas marina]|jgi:hypothetical protein|uniref:hypothetical protein n=1 Tax=Natronomonas marina TaxID=2961939 RepID=UPI0020C9B5BA|nr:hypothetical protein [Natronomonas marina]